MKICPVCGEPHEFDKAKTCYFCGANMELPEAEARKSIDIKSVREKKVKKLNDTAYDNYRPKFLDRIIILPFLCIGGAFANPFLVSPDGTDVLNGLAMLDQENYLHLLPLLLVTAIVYFNWIADHLGAIRVGLIAMASFLGISLVYWLLFYITYSFGAGFYAFFAVVGLMTALSFWRYRSVKRIIAKQLASEIEKIDKRLKLK